MPTPKQLLQRLQIPLLTACDPLYAAGRRWFRLGTSLPQEQHEQLLMSRLSRLVRSFEGRGLLREPVGRKLTGADRFATLAEMPVLTRDGLRALFPRLVDRYRRRRGISVYCTGGATGEPVQFVFSRRQRRLAGGCVLGMYSILGWHPGMPRFCLWGREPGVRPARPRGIRAYLRRRLQHTTVYGGYSPSEREYRRFIAEVQAQPGCAIFGLTSLIENCALMMREHDQQLPRGFLGALWTCSEMMFERQSRLIEDAFGCRPRRQYGSRECTMMAADCAHGNLHISPRYIIEAVDPDSYAPLPAGQTGSLLVTDLHNDVTPFIRYEIGDLGAVEWRDCDCGLRGPCLTELAGRTAGLITLPSGTRVSAHCFAAIMYLFPAVRQYQTLRLGPTEFELRYMGTELDTAARRRMEELTSDLLEGATVRIRPVEQLLLSPTGKLISYHEGAGAVGP